MKKMIFYLLLAASFLQGAAMAQIPVEVFAGNEKATLDFMFFRFFGNQAGKQSPWLFFSRNRAGVDYAMTSNTRLPQFGFTEAVSFNHKALKGVAPVLVAQIFNTGVYAKAGIQFARVKTKITIFSWLVSELKNDPSVDYFLLFRYTPPLGTRLHLFTQFETSNAWNSKTGALSLTQRLRGGLKRGQFQFGLGTDFTERGKQEFNFTSNTGLFLRIEF